MGQKTGKVAVLSLFKLASVWAQHSTGNQILIRPVGNRISSFFTNTANRGDYRYLYHCSCGIKSSTTQTMGSKCQETMPYIGGKGQYIEPDINIPCHIKARCKIYPRTTDKARLPVEDGQVEWDKDCPGYDENVESFTNPSVLKGPDWADKEDPSEQGISFNTIEENKINRKSYMGEYKIVDGYPRNPRGRTGIRGRGSLGRWGPNHAGDPIVTRWKRNDQNEIVCHEDSGKPILQFVSVQRSDNNEWALPGGMVNPGENKTAALTREFGEEALNSLEGSDEEKERIEQVLRDFFVEGSVIYKGYVDDPRNTDNAWMETKAINFHDDEGNGVGAFKLNAGDDAIGVKWMDIDSNLNLYASHIDFIRKTVELRGAHW